MEELILAVGENPKQFFMGRGIVAAFENGEISAGEEKRLQSFSQLSPSRQKKRGYNARVVTDDDVAKMRAKLNDASARLRALHPELKEPRSE